MPTAVNEPMKSDVPGSVERRELQEKLREMRGREVDIPMWIGGAAVRSGTRVRLAPPHDHGHTLGYFHKSDKVHVEQAIAAALVARVGWVELPWEHRAAVFLKAADT